MAGLNCGTPSLVAWPLLSQGIDAFLAIADEQAHQAMRALANVGIVAGETGAAGFAGLSALLTGEDAHKRRALLGINEQTRALVIVTEGATNPTLYRQIVASGEV
jgi:diaminopropionate ammonia-lyase